MTVNVIFPNILDVLYSFIFLSKRLKTQADIGLKSPAI